MANLVLDVVGSYRQTFVTGSITTIAAADATNGFLFTKRWQHATLAYRLRRLEVEFLLTTAFGAAQEMSYDFMVARGYSASCAGGTAQTFIANDAKKRTAYNNSVFVTAGDVRISNTAQLTAGTHTLDSRPFARGSFDTPAIRAKGGPFVHDFTQLEPGGLLFANNEGYIMRNVVVMGATGVGYYKVTPDWDEVLIGN